MVGVRGGLWSGVGTLRLPVSGDIFFVNDFRNVRSTKTRMAKDSVEEKRSKDVEIEETSAEDTQQATENGPEDKHSESPETANEQPEAVEAETTPEQCETSVEAFPVAASGSSTMAEVVVEEVATQEAETAEAQPSERRQMLKSASLVSIGTFGGSLMGMVRQIVVAATGPLVYPAFAAALSPTQKIFDLLVNGSVQGALIPTFTDYDTPGKREELRRLVFTLVNAVFIMMAVVAVLFFFLSSWLIPSLFVPGFSADQKILVLHFAQIIFFSLLIMGPFAILQAYSYAKKEFGWAAIAPIAYHLGIIIGAGATSLLGTRLFGTYGIAFGVILGAIGEILLLLPGLRKQGLRYMFVLDLKHPAIRHILKLYAPLAFSFLISAVFAVVDQNLASRTACMVFMHNPKGCGGDNYGAMVAATTLVQFPVGLVASALGWAVLPTLSAYMRDGQNERFKDTLQIGFRLGLLLMIPAAAGLIVLSGPIAQLIYLHGRYTADDARLIGIALNNYALQLPFVVIDQLMISAFYARKNTIVPVAVLLISEIGYLAVALPLWHTYGMPALPLANTAQIACHAIILLIWLRAVIGSLHLRKLLPTLLKLVLGAAVMYGFAWGAQRLLAHVSIFSLDHLLGRLLTVIVVGMPAAALYFGIVMLLKVEEVSMIKGALLAKFIRK